jgi:hypothetical protein
MHPESIETEPVLDEDFENIVVLEEEFEDVVVVEEDPSVDDDWMAGEFDIT